MENRNELKTPLLEIDVDQTDDGTHNRKEGDKKSDQWTGFIIQNSVAALLIFNFTTAYYLKEGPVCPVILAFVSFEGPILFLVMAYLYRQTYYDAKLKSVILLAVPEIMINLVNVLLLLKYTDEARLVIFVFTLSLSLAVVFITLKLMIAGTNQHNEDISKRESKSLTECQTV